MKTTVKKTTVKTTIPTVVFDDQSLVDTLLNVNMSVFAEVTAITDPRMNKTGNSFLGQVEKISKMNVNFGGIYKNAVEKKMEKEGIEGDYEPAPLQWGQHYRDSRVIIEHKGNFYAQMRPLRADVVSYRWKDSKRELTEEEIKEIKVFFPKKKEGSRQPTEEKVIIRTIKIPNIREIRMNGIRYQRGI